MTSNSLHIFSTAMRNIGYKSKLIRKDLVVTGFAADSETLLRVPLAGFAAEPVSYRNACLAVTTGGGSDDSQYIQMFREIGAPMVFQIIGDHAMRWRINAEAAPTLLDKLPLAHVPQAFVRNAKSWNPEAIFRAKVMRSESLSRQLDFLDTGLLPLLTGQFQERLGDFISLVAKNIAQSYLETYKEEFPDRLLFRLLFRLLAAKVYRDRKANGPWQSNNSMEILQAVEAAYGRQANDHLGSVQHLSQGLLQQAWENMLEGPSFLNLAPDDLAFVYETTFISKDTRKQNGTHSTPAALAQYLVNKLPFGILDASERRVFEPCSGHGVFLTSAMRRMGDLLDPNWTASKRHDYFVDRLIGMEQDNFACEVNVLSLILADYPNHNGWKIYNEDVFSSTLAQSEIKRANIILCNPPFEDFTSLQRKNYSNQISGVHKPIELLKKVLRDPPKLLGFILPHSLCRGQRYNEIRDEVLSHYNNVEIVEMPENVFKFSRVRSALLIAYRDEKYKGTKTTSREFSSSEWAAYLNGGPEPEGRSLETLEQPYFWIPRLHALWSYMKQYQTLGTSAEIRRGLQLKSKSQLAACNMTEISTIKLDGFNKGYTKSEDGRLTQFALLDDPVFINASPEAQHDNAYSHPWELPKVVCNAGRLSAGPWRLAAAFDNEGLTFTRQFFAFWPHSDVSPFHLLALLNSPVANAYCYIFDSDKHHRIGNIKNIPIPPLTSLQEYDVEDLARRIHNMLNRNNRSTISANDLYSLLLEMDAAVLKAYDLPPRIERQLLSMFEGEIRPIPHIQFTGYYAQNMIAAIPLHELISEEFQESTANKLLNRIQPFDDQTLSDMLKWTLE